MGLTVFEELTNALTASQIDFPTQAPGETEQDFYKRLVKAIGSVSDAVWDKIPESAQAWINESIEHINKQESVTPCQGFQTAFPEFAEKIAAEQPAVAPKAASTSKRGIMKRARQLALKNPSLTWGQLSDALKAEGWEKVSADTVYLCHQEVKNVLAAADEEGMMIVLKTYKTYVEPEPVGAAA